LSADHLLKKDANFKLCSFSKATACHNLNAQKPDLEGMAVSIVRAAIGEAVDFDPEIAIQNPRFVKIF